MPGVESTVCSHIHTQRTGGSVLEQLVCKDRWIQLQTQVQCETVLIHAKAAGCSADSVLIPGHCREANPTCVHVQQHD